MQSGRIGLVKKNKYKITTDRTCRVVLTGGPGGGKTTAADLFRREIGSRIVIVPEAATMLFTGGFPRRKEEGSIKATQSAIYHVQKNLETIQLSTFPDRILLCDRGTLDGAAYWPDSPEDFIKSLNTSWEEELGRYDAVLFFETAAAGGLSIEGGNPHRIESLKASLELDKSLREIWGKHKRFTLIRHESSFLQKIHTALATLKLVLEDLTGETIQSTNG